MKHCPNCNHENNQMSRYCERCGTLLPSPSENSFSEQTYASVNEGYTSPSEHPVTTQEQFYYSSTPPPPPPPPPPTAQNIYSIDGPPSPVYNPPPSLNYSYGPPPSIAPQPEPRRRSFGAALLSSLLYLFGAGCVAFGASGLMLQETSSVLIGSVFIVLCIVALIVLVLLLIFRKNLTLGGWMRVLITVGLTVVGVIGVFVAVAIWRQGTSEYIALGVVFVTYGLITAIVAFW